VPPAVCAAPLFSSSRGLNQSAKRIAQSTDPFGPVGPRGCHNGTLSLGHPDGGENPRSTSPTVVGRASWRLGVRARGPGRSPLKRFASIGGARTDSRSLVGGGSRFSVSSSVDGCGSACHQRVRVAGGSDRRLTGLVRGRRHARTACRYSCARASACVQTAFHPRYDRTKVPPAC